MTQRTYFTCPYCQNNFLVTRQAETFSCCGQRYRVVATGKDQRGWLPDSQRGIDLPITEPIRSFNRYPSRQPRREEIAPDFQVAMGAARLRRARRRSRSFPASLAMLFLAICLAGVALFAPVVARGNASPEFAAGSPVETRAPASATPTARPSPSAAPTATTALASPTASPAPTATPTSQPTATALPPHLLAATAWQVTLEAATGYSHATQTQAASIYAATQTALPPTLAAMAVERDMAATQAAATATQRALDYRNKIATATAKAARVR